MGVLYFISINSFWQNLIVFFWHIAQIHPGLKDAAPAHTSHEVIVMHQKRHQQRLTEDLRLDPESRICPAYNSVSIKKFYLPSDEMGMRVIDNCAEENQR